MSETDEPTRNLSNYVKQTKVNVSKMARDTGIHYMVLYDSLISDSRDRNLRVGEYFLICEFLGVDPRMFANRGDVVIETKN